MKWLRGWIIRSPFLEEPCSIKILERISLGDFFDAVADGNCITHSKPHPEVFLKAAGMLGLPPARCLAAEYARAGVKAAVAGGFHCAARNDRQAVWRLNTLSELCEYLA